MKKKTIDFAGKEVIIDENFVILRFLPCDMKFLMMKKIWLKKRMM